MLYPVKDIFINKKSDYLPDDALIEIFARATSETLVRCTSVCKKWNSIITSPAFIKAHLNHQKIRDVLIVRNCPIASQKELYSWYCDDETFTLCGQQPSMDIASKQFYRIAGSCNGILCLVDGVDDISLWNPAIRKWLKLPPQPITFVTNSQHELAIGFGIDVTFDDYKVIRVILNSRVAPKVVIYSLNSGNWEDVSHLAGELEHLSFRRENQAFVNGATHWIAYDKRMCHDIVLSFHMGYEVFRHIEVPTASSYFRPLVIEGLLSVIEGDRLMKMCCIWTMKEYGVVSSWTKHLNLDFHATPDRIIWVRKNCEVLVDVQKALCSYDPHDKEEEAANQLKDLGIHSRYRNSLHAEGFMESLVLFGRPTDIEDVAISVSSLSINTE